MGGGGAGTFPTNFFKVYNFYISKLLCSLQNCYAFEEKLLFQRDLKNHKFLIEGNSWTVKTTLLINICLNLIIMCKEGWCVELGQDGLLEGGELSEIH